MRLIFLIRDLFEVRIPINRAMRILLNAKIAQCEIDRREIVLTKIYNRLSAVLDEALRNGTKLERIEKLLRERDQKLDQLVVAAQDIQLNIGLLIENAQFQTSLVLKIHNELLPQQAETVDIIAGPVEEQKESDS